MEVDLILGFLPNIHFSVPPPWHEQWMETWLEWILAACVEWKWGLAGHNDGKTVEAMP